MSDTSVESIHVLSVGDFGYDVARRLASSLGSVTHTSFEGAPSSAPAYWPSAGAYVLAAWRPVPRLTGTLDHLCHAWRRPFLPAILEGSRLRLGPAVVPGAGACYRCYELRRLQHSKSPQVERALDRHYDENPQSGPQGHLKIFAGIAATRLEQWITALGHDPASIAGRIWSLDVLSRQVATSRVLGVHGCARCGLGRDEATRGHKPLTDDLRFLWAGEAVPS